MPHWLVALCLVLPILVVDYSGVRDRYLFSHDRAFDHGVSFLFAVALFVPGAVRRWQWRPCL